MARRLQLIHTMKSHICRPHHIREQNTQVMLFLRGFSHSLFLSKKPGTLLWSDQHIRRRTNVIYIFGQCFLRSNISTQQRSNGLCNWLCLAASRLLSEGINDLVWYKPKFRLWRIPLIVFYIPHTIKTGCLVSLSTNNDKFIFISY